MSNRSVATGYILGPLTNSDRNRLRAACKAGEFKHGHYVRWHSVALPVATLKRLGLPYRPASGGNIGRTGR